MKSNYKQLGQFIRQVDVRNAADKEENRGKPRFCFYMPVHEASAGLFGTGCPVHTNCVSVFALTGRLLFCIG